MRDTAVGLEHRHEGVVARAAVRRIAAAAEFFADPADQATTDREDAETEVAPRRLDRLHRAVDPARSGLALVHGAEHLARQRHCLGDRRGAERCLVERNALAFHRRQRFVAEVWMPTGDEHEITLSFFDGDTGRGTTCA